MEGFNDELIKRSIPFLFVLCGILAHSGALGRSGRILLHASLWRDRLGRMSSTPRDPLELSHSHLLMLI